MHMRIAYGVRFSGAIHEAGRGCIVIAKSVVTSFDIDESPIRIINVIPNRVLA
ncbi:hypothetical protein D3C87_2092490 [compost metagenome]